ncbi:hypothetical protein GCM10022393_26410 [Aquimarina addita]|uniref:Lipoprotein n=1 Tax=Aquimarina addita TaxID=870485 RepID=A0ABP6ULF5_9FLAO
MKNKLIVYIIFFSALMISYRCTDKVAKNSTSTTTTTEEPVVISSDLNKSPDVLLKQMYAHYDLEEFKKCNAKLKALLEKHPDSREALAAREFADDLAIKLNEIKQLEEQQQIEEEKRERKKRLPLSAKKMRSTTNNNVTYYMDKDSPEFDSKECFYLYFLRAGQKPKLYLKIRYVATEWLDIENCIITADQIDYTITGAVKKEEKKGKKKLFHEVLNIPIDSKEKLDILVATANSKDAITVYVGASDYKKRDLSKTQILSIRNVLDAYEYYGGDLYDAPLIE